MTLSIFESSDQAQNPSYHFIKASLLSYYFD